MKRYKSGGIYIERSLYQSDAFLSLNKNAIKVLIALYDARQRESHSQAKDKKGVKCKPKFINLDRIEMPYETLTKKYRIGQKSISLALDELLKFGFIKITHHGGLGEHDKSRYGLIDDYLRWKPGIVFRKRERDVRRGYQGRKLGVTKKHAVKMTPLYTGGFDTLPEKFCCQNDTLRKPAFSLVSVRELVA